MKNSPVSDHQTKTNASAREEHSIDHNINTIHGEALEIRFQLTVYHLLKPHFYILPAQRERLQSGMKSIVLWNVLYPGWLP